jgi:hypothetical protein
MLLHLALAVVLAATGSSSTSPYDVPDGPLPSESLVTSTIAAYYGDPGTGKANRVDSPYVTEMTELLDPSDLQRLYDAAIKRGEKPAMVFDVDDTTLMTYDMEVGVYDYDFVRSVKNSWVRNAKFPATPGMVDYVSAAASVGFTIFGVTGRAYAQKADTLKNLRKVGYTAFTSSKLYLKQDRSYVKCAAKTCTTVEYKAYTRKHIEDLGYDIVLNVGDQWSDLKGGFADKTLKLPNPTYFLASANLPGRSDPAMRARTTFRLAKDGSSGLTAGGENIPNYDLVLRARQD